MNNQEPKLMHHDELIVSGLSVRTINQDEFNPENAKLRQLWNDFMIKKLPDLASRIPNTPLYGVYSDYESDDAGYYTVTAGVSVPAVEFQTELATVKILKGDYLVFSAQGTMPEVIIALWQQIWSYFPNQSRYQRTYRTDFEVYSEPEQIKIYIGVS